MPDSTHPADLPSRLQSALGDAVVIERELGGGGMGRVFVATDTALDRKVVVKALDLEGAPSASAERFRREIKVIAQLQHPHIVPILTAGGGDSLLWYSMPYVSGESLRARLVREGALPVTDAVRIAREVLDALGAAHARGIMHRDVKPDNILLEGAHAQVADFGIAKALADAGVTTGITTAGVALGTPAYMAPEQGMADPTTNHRADIYAVGAVLFEMLVGAPPFSGSAQAVVAAHLTAPIPSVTDRRKDVPAALGKLVSELMAKNPADRPQTAVAATATLEGIVTSGPTPVPPRPVGGRKAFKVVAGVTVAAIAAFGIWKATRPRLPDFADGTEVIAVMPLGSTGDSSLARLGRDIVVTLSASIDGIGTVRAVDAMSVLQRASEVPYPMSLEDARRLATSLHASYLVHGAIIPEGTQVRINATLYDVKGGDAAARFSATGGVDRLGELTDSLSARLLQQIWRRGEPPSPMLANVTTPSTEALRAFLDGEAAFERFDFRAALEAYDRATDADSDFVQAWLRKGHVRSAAVLGGDSVVTRRIEELVAKLPERDAELREGLPEGATFADAVARRVALAGKYPEYHQAQYRAADIFIHTGPLRGVPITGAMPYLDRLDSLAPRHADNAQHRMMVALALGDTAAVRASAKRFSELGGSLASWGRVTSQLVDAYDKTGTYPTATVTAEAMRHGLAAMRELGVIRELILLNRPFTVGSAQLDSAFVTLKSDPAMRPFEQQYLIGYGTLQFTRGDVKGALATLVQLQDPGMTGVGGMRSTAVRLAATSAWLGLLPVAEAAEFISHSRPQLVSLLGGEGGDIAWSDAVLAIAREDSAAFTRAMAALSDTAESARRTARGLRALWRERRTGLVDSLTAYEDAVMSGGPTDISTIAISRLALGRALVAAGEPERAEHYLQWTDGILVPRRQVQTQRAMSGYVDYQRGLAAEAAGNRNKAILHLKRFVETVDLPPPGIADQIADAKARLDRLLRGDGR